ncbi:sigma-54-dependent Fis family transcriptional regulator [bacterium]|nr:sigma-54-dependent Fis family transcriptional regulator [bacterium]
MNDPIKILVVEDNATMREGITEVLQKQQYQIVTASNGRDALSLFKKHRADLVITDYKMNPVDGLTVLKEIKTASPDTEVILITAFGTVDVAVEAMKLGAADFITKPFSPDELSVKIEKITRIFLERRQFIKTTEENLYLRGEIEGQYNFGEIIGSSPKMVEIFQLVQKSAVSDSSVVIYGESGTGKELVARAIHYNSHRKNKPFIKVNCAALSETLLESELFGHEKGSFTGAIKTKKGRFELADTGTLFLDEIGEISSNVQVKLLRVLQEQEFERVGGEETLSVDTRIIAATNKNLQEAVKKGLFREDLYYRLHIIPLHLPPLRERREDIPKLIDFFVQRLEKDMARRPIQINPDVYELLSNYRWPGNVRELENVIERAVVLSSNNRLTVDDFTSLGQSVSEFGVQLEDVEKMGLDSALEKIEKTMIEKALFKAQGVRSEAARILGVKTSAFYYKLEKYGLL